MNTKVEDSKIIVKENVIEFLTGSYGDFRTQPKSEIAETAYMIAYDDLTDYAVLSSDEVHKICREIADEVSIDCQ